MLRRLILFVMSTNFMSIMALSSIACAWDLNPSVLLVTSYNFAQNQSTNDHLVYQKLKYYYGSKAVSAVFSSQDDNNYALILQNLIINYHLKKVFFLDPSFANYLPHTDGSSQEKSNLIRVFQYFTNVKFYFFNNQIANEIKISNNIFEFRLNKPNVANPNPMTYGKQIAKKFYERLIIEGTNKIDTTKYNFEVDPDDAKWLIKIGIINNIGNNYQQNIISEFIDGLKSDAYIPINTRYVFYTASLSQSVNIYNQTNVNLVTQSAINLYYNSKVNFIINTNSWYNSAINYAASYVKNVASYAKTINFIGDSIDDSRTLMIDNKNYLLFSYNIDWNFLNYTTEEKIPDRFKVLPIEPQSDNTYGINADLEFINGV